MTFDYFTEGELRALPHLADTGKYPDERCEAAAAHIVGIIEREVRTSFIARTVTDELYDGTGCDTLVLRKAHVLSVTSVSVAGISVPGPFTARGGVLRRSSGVWPVGIDNVSVTYEAGYSATPPPDIKEAALAGTRAYLLSTAPASAMDARRTSLSTEQGTVQFTVAGSDRPTGYPDVDATIIAWRDKLGVFGFA